jgi:hypothetical protein
MSIRIASLVRKYGPKNHGDFVVLLALADHANNAGGDCWPSVKTIAAEMRIGERSVARSLSVLEDRGWISVMRRSRDHKGNSYKIVMEKLKSLATVAGENDELPATEAGGENVEVTCQPVQVTCQIRQSHLPNPTESPAKSASVSILFNRPEPSMNRPEPSSLAPSVIKQRSMPEAMTVFDLPLIGGKEYGVPQKLYNEYVAAFPGVSVMAELARLRVWLLSNPTRMKTIKGMPRFMNHWLSKEQDRQPPQHGGRNYGALPHGKADGNLAILAESLRDGKREDRAHAHGLLPPGGDGSGDA